MSGTTTLPTFQPETELRAEDLNALSTAIGALRTQVAALPTTTTTGTGTGTGTTTGTGTNTGTGGTGTTGSGSTTGTTTTTATAPSVPTGLKVGTASVTAVPLTWNGSTSGTQPITYTVLFRASGATAWSIWTSGLTGTSTTVAGLQPATTYQFEVLAVNSAAPNGVATSIVSGTTLAVAPSAVVSLAASSETSSSIAVAWQAPTTGTQPISYTVQYRITGSGAAWTTAAGMPISALNFTLTGLAAATSYDIQVIAQNSNPTTAAASITASTTAPATVAPTAPTGVTASAITSSSMTVSWVAPSTGTQPLNYTVTWATGTHSYYESTSNTSAPLPALSSGTQYTITVQASNSAGSATSSAITATTTAAAAAPSSGGVTGTQTSGTTAPIISGPANASVPVGGVLSVTGLSVSDPSAATAAGNCALDVTCTNGTITMTDSTGAAIAGSGTNSIWNYSTTLNGVNAALASMIYTPPANTGSDAIDITVYDMFGANSALTVPVLITAAGTTSTSGSGSTVTPISGALPSDATGVQTSPSQDYVGRWGVNMHVGTINDGYTAAVYNNITTTAYASILANLQYLCVGLIRDWAYAPPAADQGIAYWPKLAAAVPAKYIAVTPGNITGTDLTAAFNQYRSVASQNPGAFWAYEGMNEPDAELNGGDGSGIAVADAFQPTVWSGAQSDGLYCIDWSRGNFGTVGTAGQNMAPYCNSNSIHAYFNPHMRGPNSGGVLDYIINAYDQGDPSGPLSITEWGYPTPYAAQNGVSNAAQAVYVLQSIHGMYLRGCAAYTYYAIYDDGSGNWGLFNNDYTPRQSATAVHNLLSVLQDLTTDSTKIATGKLNITYSVPLVAANAQGMKAAHLQNAAGHFFAVICNEQDVTAEGGADITWPANVQQTVTLGTTAKTINLYDPMKGNTPIQTWNGVTSITIGIPPYPVVLEIVQ